MVSIPLFIMPKSIENKDSAKKNRQKRYGDTPYYI